jgi:putative hydrolase of HD superfamily
MKQTLESLIEFVKFTHKIRMVKRAILLEKPGHYENDEEHMYQLALSAWYIIDSDNLKLDRAKCIAMAIVHDITEAYAGDTNAHASAADRAAHEKREELAIGQLKKDWPALSSMSDLINEYRQRKTPESQFVYALDKLLPILNIYVYKGNSWQEQGIDFAEMQRVKVGKVDIDPTIKNYYDQFIDLLKDHQEVFGTREAKG